MMHDEDLRPVWQDVRLERIKRPTCECGKTVTHQVRMEHRAIGTSSIIAEGCAHCCQDLQRRMREVLR